LDELRNKIEGGVNLNDGVLDKRKQDFVIIQRAIEEITGRVQGL
jgi:hypothetical protein